MRLTPPRLEDYRVVTPDFVRRASTLASSCSTALFRAVVVSAWIIGCVTYPSAHADTIYGTGSYTVPDQLPYGIYIAHADPGGSTGSIMPPLQRRTLALMAPSGL